MQLKKIDEVKRGDVLAEGLTNAQGLVLIRPGTALTDDHLRLLRMWGIHAVKLQGGDAGTGAAVIDDEVLDEAETEIKRRFGRSLDNEIMAEVLRVAVEQHAAKLVAARVVRQG